MSIISDPEDHDHPPTIIEAQFKNKKKGTLVLVVVPLLLVLVAAAGSCSPQVVSSTKRLLRSRDSNAYFVLTNFETALEELKEVEERQINNYEEKIDDEEPPEHEFNNYVEDNNLHDQKNVIYELEEKVNELENKISSLEIMQTSMHHDVMEEFKDITYQNELDEYPVEYEDDEEEGKNDDIDANDEDSVSSSFLMKREIPDVPPSDQLKEQNGQNRAGEQLGSKQDGFEHIHAYKAKERRKQMNYLQQVRSDASKCGGSLESNWKLDPKEYEYMYYGNAVEKQKKDYTIIKTQRHSCDAPHPKYYNDDKLQIHIERYGPFKSTGNGDWSTYYSRGEPLYDYNSYPPDDKLLMREQLLAHNRDLYIRGTFASIVNDNGEFQNYPPLHMHHFHLHPYHNGVETMDKLLPKRVNGKEPDYKIGIVGSGSAFMDHHIMGQQHGDSVCNIDGVDDFSCLLHLFPEGHGMRVKDSSGFRLDFEVNDVRTPKTESENEEIPGRLEPLEFYVEVAIFWTPKPQIPATYLHISAPEDGFGPATYAIPIDDSSSMIYYNYTHDWRDDDHLQVWDPQDERLAAGVRGVQGLGAGTISNIVGHVHNTMFDSLYIFKESNKSRKVFEAIDEIRPENYYLPYIPECHHTTLEHTKDRVTKLAMQDGGGELVCEVTKPGLVWAQIPSGNLEEHNNNKQTTLKSPSYAYFDRQMDLNCKKEIRLEPGDTLTFLVFTKSRPTSTLGHIQRGSFAHHSAGVFESEMFAQSEHTIMRMDFVSDKALTMTSNNAAKNAGAMDDLYTPPVLYLTQRWVHGASDEACVNAMRGKQWFSFVNKNNKGWDDILPDDYDRDAYLYCHDKWTARFDSMMNQCPVSISMKVSEDHNE